MSHVSNVAKALAQTYGIMNNVFGLVLLSEWTISGDVLGNVNLVGPTYLQFFVYLSSIFFKIVYIHFILHPLYFHPVYTRSSSIYSSICSSIIFFSIYPDKSSVQNMNSYIIRNYNPAAGKQSFTKLLKLSELGTQAIILIQPCP
jgi:hypothetical protein